MLNMTRKVGKMTLILNPKSYGELLAKYQPKVITTEEDNEQAIALAQELEHRQVRTPEEDALLELLIALIEKFEDQYYPIPQSSPHSIVNHLMESNNLIPDDLAGVLGSKEIVSQLLDGQLTLSQLQAQKLADFFNIDSSLLINQEIRH